MPDRDRRAPLLIVSPGSADDLRTSIEATGREIERVQQLGELHSVFASSPAMLVIVDVRDLVPRALAMMRMLAEAVERRGAAMVAIVTNADAARAAHAAGATHFLQWTDGGDNDALLEQSLRTAGRYTRRVRAGGAHAAMVTAQAALAGSGRWDWDLNSRKVRLSPTLASMLGERPGQVSVKSATRALAAGERMKTRAAVERLLASGVPGDVETVMRLDGRRRTIIHHLRPRLDPDGAIIGVTATIDDAEALALDRRLSSHFDPVSGLASQRYVHTWLDQLLGTRSLIEPAAAAVLIAISRFEAINAAYGRAVGDAAIQAIGRSLRRLAEDLMPEGQTVSGRSGGAEFAIGFAPPFEVEQVERFCAEVAQMFDRPFIIGARVLHLSCRMGVAIGEAGLASGDALMRRATSALAIAKRGEPNTWHIVRSGGELEEGQARAAGLRTDLRRTLGDPDSDEIEVLFQPQVEITSSRIVGVEALVRWRHPTLGPLSADVVLEAAEGAELMPRLGRRVMRTALTHAVSWPEALADLRVSVNVTAHDLRVPEFESELLAAIEDTGFPAARLTLEVTESGLIEDTDRAAALLSRLRALGIKIAIDDFGTGYSSLAYLKSLPIDTLKVDKALITNLSGTARDRVVVRGVVDMARSLGIGVVAEGVETHEQLELVVREGCNSFQGYLCSRPLTATALAEFVPDWQARAAVV